MDNPFLNSGIFDDSSELSLEQMLAYLNGELNNSEKQEVEQMLSNDPLLAESMEGLEQMSKEERENILPLLFASKQSLAERIAKGNTGKTGEEMLGNESAVVGGKGAVVRKMSTVKWLSIAAVLVAVVGIGFMFVNSGDDVERMAEVYDKHYESYPNEIKDEPETAGSEDSESEVILEKSDASIPPAPPKIAVVEDATIKEKVAISEDVLMPEEIEYDLEEEALEDEAAKDFKWQAPPPPPPPMATRSSEWGASVDDIAKEEESKAYSKAKKESYSSNARTDNYYDVTLSDTVDLNVGSTTPQKIQVEEIAAVESKNLSQIEVASAKSGRKKKPTRYRQDKVVLDAQNDVAEADKNSADLLDKAMLAYDSKKYPEAIALFSEVLDLQPNNSTVLFYQAQSYLNSDNPSASVKNLKKVLKDEGSGFTDEANWYLALSYLRLGKSKDATKLLNKIIESESPFKAKAQEALRELGN